jgi:hypothetical protein
MEMLFFCGAKCRLWPHLGYFVAPAAGLQQAAYIVT